MLSIFNNWSFIATNYNVPGFSWIALFHPDNAYVKLIEAARNQ